jgi:hypothetical protein
LDKSAWNCQHRYFYSDKSAWKYNTPHFHFKTVRAAVRGLETVMDKQIATD